MHFPSLVPAPESIELSGGELRLTSGSRILSTAELQPLAQVLSEEIRLVTGLCLDTAQAEPAAGDMALRIEPGTYAEEYRVVVGDGIEVTGADLNAIALGTTTLLQAIDCDDGVVTVPHMRVDDRPHFSWRGLLIDVARHWHDVKTLERLIVLARYYKIRSVQLHLTDDESFTFPSREFPELATEDRHYTIEELRELEDFARSRGVTLVPELDVPGHSAPLRRLAPFGWSSERKVIDMASEGVYEALKALVGEMCEVFSSPWFHIGADECDLTGVGSSKQEQAYMVEHGLADSRDLHAHFIVRMNEIVRVHGRRTLVWEGFRGTGSDHVEIPRDILVFVWDTRYELPENLLRNGFEMVNASWKPLYVTPDKRWSPESIHVWWPYTWEHWDEKAPSFTPMWLPDDPSILGGQMCSWEQTQADEIVTLRSRVPALSESLWCNDPEIEFSDFERRFAVTDPRLDRLLGGL